MYTLGLEFSTQSVKMVVLDIKKGSMIYADSFDYDSQFPEYQTVGGILPDSDAAIRHTSPLMIVSALDQAFSKLKKDGVNMTEIAALKTDCMQHCTVYTNQSFKMKLAGIDKGLTLKDALSGCFSRKTAPVWEDRSTENEVRCLDERLEKDSGIQGYTGNRAELRFPAAQIIKWIKDKPEEYERTSNIFLLSAFITSILAGRIAPVDTGDGWGTNLNHIDINNPGWSNEVVNAAETCSGINDVNLIPKIGGMTHYDSPAGYISGYFVEKYNLPENAVVLTGTGDNPATLFGCGCDTVISLGSSYTVNGVMNTPHLSTGMEYNVFGFTKGNTMALTVFTNGGKVHDNFLKKYITRTKNSVPCKSDWDVYLTKTGRFLLSPDEKIMLPYLYPESVPVSASGLIRENFDSDDPEVNIRALHISQILSMRCHSDHLNPGGQICIAGGGANNLFLRQLIADFFNVEVFAIDNAAYTAPLGCAISCAKMLLDISYKDAAEMFVQKDNSSFCSPVSENQAVADQLLKRYHLLEQKGTK